MQVRFWGTRGSIAAPGPATIRYGGNTSCVEVRLDDDTLIIFDAGTGLRALGQALLAQPGPVHAHLFLSHAHWDHIQGIPFFAPAYIAGTELTILGPEHGHLTLEKIVTGQMRSPYFPIPMHAMAAKIEFVKLGERSVVELPNGVTVEAGVLNHPGCTLGYRLTANGKVLAYTTDNEPFGAAAPGQTFPPHVSSTQGGSPHPGCPVHAGGIRSASPRLGAFHLPRCPADCAAGAGQTSGPLPSRPESF